MLFRKKSNSAAVGLAAVLVFLRKALYLVAWFSGWRVQFYVVLTLGFYEYVRICVALLTVVFGASS